MNGFDSGLNRRAALAALGSTGLWTMTANAVAAEAPARDSLTNAVEKLRVAMVSGDRDVLNALLHDRLNYMHSSGKSQTKQDLMEELAGRNFFASFVHCDLTIDVVGDVGVVKLTANQVKNLADGGTRPSRIVVLHTWLTTGNAWQLLTRASALVGTAPTASAGNYSGSRQTNFEGQL